ncbi:hypothetical protein AVEN_166058-1, partial [Araneus ventricosus]
YDVNVIQDMEGTNKPWLTRDYPTAQEVTGNLIAEEKDDTLILEDS